MAQQPSEYSCNLVFVPFLFFFLRALTHRVAIPFASVSVYVRYTCVRVRV